MSPTARIRTAALAAVLALSALAGCASNTGDDGPLPLTTEQAQALAVARFQNFDAGIREVVIEVGGSEAVTLTGWVDFAAHEAYAAATDAATGAGLGLLRWTLDTVGAYDGAVPAELLPPPQDGWSTGALDPAGSALTNAMALVLSLGADRPDNPQLLQQTDARFLRLDEIDGVEVLVIAGPSSDAVATASPVDGVETTRYWITPTGRLLRFESRQSAATDAWTVMAFGDDAAVDLGVVPGVSDGTAS